MCCAFTQIQVRGGKHSVRSVHASADGTFLLKTNGRVLACGSNEHNKLGLNCSAKGLRKRKEEVTAQLRPPAIRPHPDVFRMAINTL